MIELGYLEGSPPSTESTLNYLMKMALEKVGKVETEERRKRLLKIAKFNSISIQVAFLPFGYLIDAYRWKIFDGTIPRSNLTYNWIKMR